MASTFPYRSAAIGLAVAATASSVLINPGIALVAAPLLLKTMTEPRTPVKTIFMVPRN